MVPASAASASTGLLRPDQLEEAALDRRGRVGDVEGRGVHRDDADQRHGRVAGEGGAAVSEAPEVAVGIADRDGRDAPRPGRAPARAVADGRAGGDLADLHDPALQADDGPHRVRRARDRREAVERGAWPRQVEVEVGAEKDARGVGEARGCLRQPRPRRLEAAKLLPVHGMVLALRTGKMTHDETQLGCRRVALGSQRACRARLHPGQAATCRCRPGAPLAAPARGAGQGRPRRRPGRGCSGPASPDAARTRARLRPQGRSARRSRPRAVAGGARAPRRGARRRTSGNPRPRALARPPPRRDHRRRL